MLGAVHPTNWLLDLPSSLSTEQLQLDQIYNVIGDEVSLDKGQHVNSC
jgi:hypothetical protein